MVGFRILVNFRGELQEVIQPGVTNGDEE